MESVFISLLGNRDLQISRKAEIPLLHKEWFVLNNDDADYLIIDKSKWNFFEKSEIIYHDYDKEYSRIINFPIVERAIEEIGTPFKKIIFTTSNQTTHDKQDCLYAALIAQKHYQNKGFEADIKLFPDNPTDFSKLLEFYIALFSEYKDYKIFFGNSGGTPDMRAASYFAGVFKDIEFVTVNAREKKVNKTNFKKQENEILRHIINRMLSVYDFEGIRNLPVSIGIRKVCQEAIDKYNLVLSENKNEKNTIKHYTDFAKNAINLLLNNMEACHIQGRYADVVGRIFRIEEATWQLLFFNEIKEAGLIDEKDNVVAIDSEGKIVKNKFEKFLKNESYLEKLLTQNYPSHFTLIEGKMSFINFPVVPVRSGKNFFYFFFRSLEKNCAICDFFAKLNNNYDQNDNKLVTLRNNSIMGHGFKGVSKAEIETVTGSFETYYSELIEILELKLGVKYTPVFNNFRKDIGVLINSPENA
ncbi:MAG: hypothetical protein NTX61_16445 [Bacteroidetes bacterium]|nr:hypothetical protein [Bacteroidota bacterium]